jgi:hypothetical protein
MDLIGEFFGRLFWELTPLINCALNNWAITLVGLILLICWAGNERRRSKHV